MTLQNRVGRLPHPAQIALTGNAIGEAAGDAMTRTLLPIIAITTVGVNAGTIGVINALGFVAFLALGPIAGALVDRNEHPYRFMASATLARIAALAVALAAWAAGLLAGATGMTVVIMIAAITGIADVLYSSGQGKLIAQITPPEELQSSYGRIITWGQGGTLLGPVLVSALLAIVVEPLAMLLPLAAYAAALLAGPCLRKASVSSQVHRDVDQAPKTKVPLGQQIRAGFHTITQHPILRAVTAANALINCAIMVGNTVTPVFVLQKIGAPTAHYALIGTVGAAAGIIGASIAAKVVEKLGLVTTRVACGVLMAAGVSTLLGAQGLLNLLPGSTLIWVAVNSATGAIGVSVIMVAGAHLPARCVPHDELGSVQAAARTIVMGAMPIMSLIAGAATLAVGVLPVMCAWLVLQLIAIVPNIWLTNADQYFLPIKDESQPVCQE